MQDYTKMSKDELLEEKAKVEAKYKEYKDMGLKLDMSRGKPSSDQLDKCMPILDALTSKDDIHASNGFDTRIDECLYWHVLAALAELADAHV